MKIIALNNENWLECTGTFLADDEENDEYYQNLNMPIPERGLDQIPLFLKVSTIIGFNSSSEKECVAVRINDGKVFIIKGSTSSLCDTLKTLNKSIR